MSGTGGAPDGRHDAYRRLALWQDLLVEPLLTPLRELGVRLADPAAGARVLDVGCGTGTGLVRYAARGCAVTGVDISPAMLARARRRLGAAAELQLAPATALPYPAGRFDLVLASLMLHELDAATRDAVVSEVLRVLRPGGAVLVTEFHPGRPGSAYGRLARLVGAVAETVAGHRDRSDAFLAAGGVPALAARHGLRVDRVRVVAGATMSVSLLRPG